MDQLLVGAPAISAAGCEMAANQAVDGCHASTINSRNSQRPRRGAGCVFGLTRTTRTCSSIPEKLSDCRCRDHAAPADLDGPQPSRLDLLEQPGLAAVQDPAGTRCAVRHPLG